MTEPNKIKLKVEGDIDFEGLYKKLWHTGEIPLKRRPRIPFPAPITLLVPFKARQYSEGYLESLETSIRNVGMIHKPLATVNVEAKNFPVLSGNARAIAAKRIPMPYLEVNLIFLTKEETYQILFEGNEQDEMNPIDEAVWYRDWQAETGITQAKIAEKRNLKQSTIANKIRLLTLPPYVIKLMRQGKVSVNQALQILTVKDMKTQVELAELCAEGLSDKELKSRIEQAKLKQLAGKAKYFDEERIKPTKPTPSKPSKKPPRTEPPKIDKEDETKFERKLSEHDYFRSNIDSWYAQCQLTDCPYCPIRDDTCVPLIRTYRQIMNRKPEEIPEHYQKLIKFLKEKGELRQLY